MTSLVIRTIERITRWAGWLGALVTVPLIFAMVYEVAVRYVFNSPTFWAYELGYMMMGTGLMLGIAYAMQTDSHVRVDFFYHSRSKKGRAVIDLIGYAVLLPMIVWLCFGLGEYFHRAYVSSEVSGESAWNPVVWPFRIFFFVGFVLFVLQTIAEILKSISLLAGIELAASENDGQGIQ